MVPQNSYKHILTESMEFLCWKVTLRSANTTFFIDEKKTCLRLHDKLIAETGLGHNFLDFLLPPHTFLPLPGCTTVPINW